MKKEKCEQIKVEYTDDFGKTEKETIMIPETIFRYFRCYSKENGISFGKAIERHVYFSCFKKFPTRIPDWIIEAALFVFGIIAVFAFTSLIMI